MGRPEEDVDQKEKEVLLIVVANAVVYPRTVMVHPGDAALANRAVVALGSFNCVTLFALLAQDYF
jgi:hypothetical protein